MEYQANASLFRPLIGILTMDDPAESFRGNRNNFIDIIRTGEEMGVSVCVITVKDLKLKHRRMIGSMYDSATKTWRPRTIGLPHVIYNRIPQREDEALPEVKQTLAACAKHPHTQLFNAGFFDKWSLFEWLKNGRFTSKYIPATRKLGGIEDLEELLRLYPSVYMKPISGKAGKGIMKVERLAGKRNRKTEYALRVQDTKGSVVYKYPKLPLLWVKAKEEMGQEVYIAQQGIALARHKKRPFDLRVLVQKTYKGQWDVTGIGARRAGKLSITTHVPRGGSIDNPRKLLASTFGAAGARRILMRARRAALAIARQVERQSGYLLGEMSMDLGVDVRGGIWFFEANSKPMKFDEPHIRKKSLERIVHFSLHLIRSRQAKAGAIAVGKSG